MPFPLFTNLRALLMILLLAGATGCEERKESPPSAFSALKAAGGEIGTALESFRQQKQHWPKALSELSQEGILRDSKALRYPKIAVLASQEDYLKPDARVEWAEWNYYAPPAGSQDTPLLVAPLPFIEADGRKLEKPQRLVIKVGTPAQTVNDEDVSALVEMLAPR